METSTDTRPRARRRALVALLATVAVAAVVVGGILVARAGDDSDASEAIAAMQAACHDWMATDGGPGDPEWCDGMAGWMAGRMGRHGMGAPAMQGMWGDPAKMRATCQEWMASDGGPGDPGWCDAMAGGMAGRMGGPGG